MATSTRVVRDSGRSGAASACTISCLWAATPAARVARPGATPALPLGTPRTRHASPKCGNVTSQKRKRARIINLLPRASGCRVPPAPWPRPRPTPAKNRRAHADREGREGTEAARARRPVGSHVVHQKSGEGGDDLECAAAAAQGRDRAAPARQRGGRARGPPPLRGALKRSQRRRQSARRAQQIRRARCEWWTRWARRCTQWMSYCAVPAP
eukprot:scaffold32022_cov62-Phaeocystis_antarctica.AAC.8